jgi:hypothetical protein
MERPEEGEAPGARLKFYYCLHNDCLESVVHFENKGDYLKHMKEEHGVRPPPKKKSSKKKSSKKKSSKKIPENIPENPKKKDKMKGKKKTKRQKRQKRQRN